MASQKLAEFQGIDYSLEKSREETFVAALIAALETHNSEAFGVAASEYNSIKKIDPWMTTLLLQVSALWSRNKVHTKTTLRPHKLTYVFWLPDEANNRGGSRGNTKGR